MNYQAPINELRFALQVHGKLPEILALPASDGLDADTVDAVLEEAARFAEQVLAPTNRTGDLHGAKLTNGKVETHPDLVNAYHEYRDAGWAGLRAPRLPSAFTRYLGTINIEMPCTPGGASGRRASTK